jgi:hypothetical protein
MSRGEPDGARPKRRRRGIGQSWDRLDTTFSDGEIEADDPRGRFRPLGELIAERLAALAPIGTRLPAPVRRETGRSR